MTNDVIDFRQPLAEIRQRYGSRYFLNPKATGEAAALWGFACNDAGVVMEREIETIFQFKQYSAQVHFARSPKKHYLIGLSARTPISGMSFAPSVWHGIGYHSEEGARLAGIERLHGFFLFEYERKDSSTSAVNRRNLEQVLRLLEDARQPSLF